MNTNQFKKNLLIFDEFICLATFVCCATCCQALVMFFGIKGCAALATRTYTSLSRCYRRLRRASCAFASFTFALVIFCCCLELSVCCRMISTPTPTRVTDFNFSVLFELVRAATWQQQLRSTLPCIGVGVVADLRGVCASRRRRRRRLTALSISIVCGRA